MPQPWGSTDWSHMLSSFPRVSKSNSIKQYLCWQLTLFRVGSSCPCSVKVSYRIQWSWFYCTWHSRTWLSAAHGPHKCSCLVLGHLWCWVYSSLKILHMQFLSDAMMTNLKVECPVSPLASVFVSGSWDVTSLERRVSLRDTLFPSVVDNYQGPESLLSGLLRVWTWEKKKSLNMGVMFS